MFVLGKILVATLALAGLGANAPVSLDKRLPGRVVRAGDPLVIDPNGDYIRVSSMNDGSLIGGYAATEGQPRSFASFDPPTAPSHDSASASGKTFKYLSTVEEHVPNGVNGLWEPYLRLTRDGILQCYYSAENSAADQDNFMKYSKDGGQTWSRWVAVSCGDRLSRDGMVGVAPVENNGNLIARNGKISGAPQVYNAWGTLVTSFMTNEDADNGYGYDFAEMKVITSVNGGKTWSSSVVTGPAQAHWPGLFNRDPTHFLALYSREGIGAVSQLYELTN
ncbi:hypothetical protein ColLi_09911 [Colletotrichum liriopes]|uniref:Uncharacterized protein n=1 Tax=Colletotrichum liriopes TaxID=708192 RepID=A0AA37LX04_9PEZI|nr:hypothetical protein ColLi_09911 [Colletotrichum liriopes]